MAIAYQLDEPTAPQTFLAERELALAVFERSLADLDVAKERSHAAAFLLRNFWDSVWHQWLPQLDKGRVTQLVRERLATYHTRRLNGRRKIYIVRRAEKELRRQRPATQP